MEELKKRMARSARVQEGEQPPENPTELLAELDRLLDRWLELVQSVNRTNSATIVERGTLSDAIARRNALGKRRQLLSDFVDAASTRQDRYTKSEVKFLATIPIGEIQKQVDRLAKEFRDLDTRIQEVNWKTDLS